MGFLPPTKLPLPPVTAVVVMVGLNKEDVIGQSTDQTIGHCVMCIGRRSHAVVPYHRLAVYRRVNSV